MTLRRTLLSIGSATLVAGGAVAAFAQMHVTSMNMGNAPMQIALAFDPDCSTVQLLSLDPDRLTVYLQRYPWLTLSLSAGECIGGGSADQPSVVMAKLT